MKLSLYNKLIKSINIGLLESKLFDDDILDSDELTLDELNIADNLTDYTDLGLPSGTLWCSHNVGTKKQEGTGKYFTINDIPFENLPTYELIEELFTECEYNDSSINGVNGYKITGKNGKSIFMPFTGFYNYKYRPEYRIQEYNKRGFYWSSSNNDNSIGSIIFYKNAVTSNEHPDNYLLGFTTRTVKKIIKL